MVTADEGRPQSGDLDYDVVIAGYGPVGAVFANLLGAQGHRVAIFERAPSVYHLPRAAHFDHEIMRVFQSIGLAEAILPATTSIDGLDFLRADGRRLFGFVQPKGPTPFSWQNSYMFYQPALETALRIGVDRYPNVEVFLEHEIVGAGDEGDHAEVAVRDLNTSADWVVSAQYVLGCDGARSVTRQAVDLTVHDIGFNESWLVIDLSLKTPVDLPTVCQQICDPARPTTFVPMPEPFSRFEFMLLPDEGSAAMEETERVYELLAPWVTEAQADVVRAVVYTFHAVLATEWRRGRVLLAGDSAHQMPPFLGQGMCSGIRDAANLAWKLDLVLRGVAGDALLDSYDDERAPHVRTIIDAAVGFGGLICTTDPEVAAARDKQFLENPEAMSEVGTTFLPTLGPGVLALDDEGRLADGVGRLFLQPWVRRASGEEAMLDDVLGGGFSLLLFDPDGPERGVAALRAMGDDMKSAWMAVGGRSIVVVPAGSKISGVAVSDGFVEVVEDRDGFLSNWFNDHQAAGVLVRPDRYVFGVTPDVGAAVSLVAEVVNAVGA